MLGIYKNICTFVLDNHTFDSVQLHTATPNYSGVSRRAYYRMCGCQNSGGSVPFLNKSLFYEMTTTRKAMQGVKHSSAASCAIVRDTTHIIGSHATTEYYIGWGDILQGDSLTYSELWQLHRLISKVLHLGRKGVSCVPTSASGVVTTTYRLGKHKRIECISYESIIN